MPAKQFRKKPVEVWAIQWTGDNADEIKEFVGLSPFGEGGFLTSDESVGDSPALVWNFSHSDWNTVQLGNWIICGTAGECYPVERSILEATFEPVESA